MNDAVGDTARILDGPDDISRRIVQRAHKRVAAKQEHLPLVRLRDEAFTGRNGRALAE